MPFVTEKVHMNQQKAKHLDETKGARSNGAILQKWLFCQSISLDYVMVKDSSFLKVLTVLVWNKDTLQTYAV